MHQPEQIRLQREILHTFRELTIQRIKLEADAEAQRKAEENSAASALNRIKTTLAGRMAELQKIQEETRTALAEDGLLFLLEQLGSVSPSVHSSDNPAQELDHAVNTAADALQAIKEGIQSLREWRERKAKLSLWVPLFSIFALLCLAVYVLWLLSLR